MDSTLLYWLFYNYQNPDLIADASDCFESEPYAPTYLPYGGLDSDRTYMSTLIKNKLNLKKGSSVPHKEKVGNMTFDQVKEVAEEKMPDLNAVDVAGAMKTVQGTARASGITTEVDGMTKEEIAAKLG